MAREDWLDPAFLDRMLAALDGFAARAPLKALPRPAARLWPRLGERPGASCHRDQGPGG